MTRCVLNIALPFVCSKGLLATPETEQGPTVRSGRIRLPKGFTFLAHSLVSQVAGSRLEGNGKCLSSVLVSVMNPPSVAGNGSKGPYMRSHWVLPHPRPP